MVSGSVCRKLHNPGRISRTLFSSLLTCQVMQIRIDTCSSYIKGSTKPTTLSEILLCQLVQVCEKTEKTVEPGIKVCYIL